jgi:mediator of RNA polymerase II transcription subunit 12
MNKPQEGLYPLNDSEILGNGSKGVETYPDYQPWADSSGPGTGSGDGKDDKMNSSYLSKGYFESPAVSNEYYSARNMVQATMFSSADNCSAVLNELSQHLANAYKTRNEVINKVKYESNNFRIPPRVTLTASKKEAWLRDLANPNFPLLKIGEKISHGIRNKVLVDTVASRNVPMNRAIWFTKCVLFGELITLKKKHHSRTQINSPHPQHVNLSWDKVEAQWFQEWTQQVVDYIYKYSKEMNTINSVERKQLYMAKYHYIFQYVESLYVECLLDKNYFLSLIFKLFKEGLPLDPLEISQILALTKLDEDGYDIDSSFDQVDFNYGQRLTALAMVKVFWKDILKFDYLCKELSELLLLNYFFIENMSTLKLNTNVELPESIKLNLLSQISSTITYLFKSNSNVFIIPNYWVVVRGTLYKILLNENIDFETGEREDFLKQLEITAYRNESLMLNMKQVKSVYNDGQLSHKESAYTSINRNADDILRMVQQLNDLKLNDELAELLKPSSKSKKVSWRIYLHLVLMWSITSIVNKNSTEGILIVCNFIKKRVVQKLSNHNLKVEFENEILETLYNVAENYNAKIIEYNFYVLINELYQLKILTISAYLRKLIASGIFHIANENEMLHYNSPVKIHLAILQNLPVINNKQCNNILQKWNPDGCTFKEYLDAGKDTLRKEFLEKILHNSFDSDFEAKTLSIRKLDVGIKFLLINWLTTELKNEISASPKLVHINPSIITNIYYLYLWCDNLTVFFKDVVKFILKNEGGMIISYMDSLYLIAKLTMKHFKLVKFLAGTFSEIATGYELFNLIILSYRDLISNEFDYFKFGQVWSFIDGAVERNPTLKLQKKDSLKLSGVFDKTIIESPMKINPPDTHISTRSNDRLPLVEFYANLSFVLNHAKSTIDNTEIRDLLQNLHIEIEPINSELFISSILQRLSEAENEDIESYATKLLINSQQILHNEKSSLFEDVLQKFILEKINVSNNDFKTFAFLKTLVAYEIIPLNELLLFIRTNVTNEDQQKQIAFEILMKDNRNTLISTTKMLMLTMVRENFKSHFPLKFHTFMKQNITSPIPLSYLFQHYPKEAIHYMEHAIVCNPRFFYNELIFDFTPDDLTHLATLIVDIPENIQVNNLDDLPKVACLVDEVNMPVFQLLLRATTIKDLGDLPYDTQRHKMESTINSCIRQFQFGFSKNNSYFGELFTSLTSEHKSLVLEILEDIFLLSTEIKQDAETRSVNLKINGCDMNLLPIFNDFFKKFSASSTTMMNTNEAFFDNLCSFLSKLIVLLEQKLRGTDIENDLRDTISIFLRILIIHKLSLTSIILNQNNKLMKFVKDLISLINCELLCNENDKLKILLYDLLLLMKTSLTQGVSLLMENDSNGDTTSPGMLQAHTSPSTDGKTGDSHSPGTICSKPNSTDLSSIFTLPEPTIDNPLEKYIDDSKVDTVITLEEEELSRGGDIHYVNNANLVLVQARNDTVPLTNPFSILGETSSTTDSPSKPATKPFHLKSFEIFEDSSQLLNDGCINLHFFDAYTIRENLP